VQNLVLTPSVEEMRQPVRRHRPPPPTATADIMAQLARSRPEPEAAAEPVPAVVDEAEREETIVSIVAEMVDDQDAAFRTDAVLYQDFLVRCRIRRLQGAPVSLPEFRRRLAVAKAKIDHELAKGEPWQQALRLSASLPDDLQALFLIVAKAAISGEPCPPDSALARAYGTHSTRRARRLLTYFEEQGVAVVRTDFHGRRIVAFPDIGCETAPGDPDAGDAPLAQAAE
jgi:hypothetical protein